MKTSKRTSWQVVVAVTILVACAFASTLFGQTAAAKPSGAGTGQATQWSVQVERVNPGDLGVSDSFQVAIYEMLLTELNKTNQFHQVFREGDRKAQDIPSLLILKTTVEKYTAGSETRRAVTTVTGATKLTVRSQLITRDGKVVLDRTVSGQVRLFGSNMKATHNLASNLAKVINESQVSTSDQPPSVLVGKL